jgi:uncharacterized protein (TIGR03382 family)
MPPLRWTVIAVCASATIQGRAVAQTASFDLVGIAPGGAGSFAYALSADGRVAAGLSSQVGGSGYPGFTWTRSGGRVDFGLANGLPAQTGAYGISADGSVVVGLAVPVAGGGQAFRWSGPGTFQTLGVFSSYTRSYGEGISGDGSVVVGRAEQGTPNTIGQAFRWTQAGGMQGLGFARPGDHYSEATAISRDAGSVVGWSRDPGGFTGAFVWTASAGMQELAQVAGTPFRDSYALGVNFDGSVIVGLSGPNLDAAIWRNGVPSALGLPTGYSHSLARAVADDGNTVVGNAYPRVGDQAAVIWAGPSGPRFLYDYLTARGVGIPAGWSLRDCFCISADGNTFAGIAVGPGLATQGFVATIPATGTAPLLALAGSGALVRRRRSQARPRSGLASRP